MRPDQTALTLAATVQHAQATTLGELIRQKIAEEESRREPTISDDLPDFLFRKVKPALTQEQVLNVVKMLAEFEGERQQAKAATGDAKERFRKWLNNELHPDCPGRKQKVLVCVDDAYLDAAADAAAEIFAAANGRVECEPIINLAFPPGSEGRDQAYGDLEFRKRNPSTRKD
jgi:hypothetical protein